MRAIVVHPGLAHRDDVLATALAVAHYGCSRVFRREPTRYDLRDPKTLVLDCGGRHEPELGNFDHHQLPRDAPPTCAFALLAEHLGVDFSGSAWYEPTLTADSKGMVALAACYGMPVENLMRAYSPIEAWLKSEFGKVRDLVPKFLIDVLNSIGTGLLLADVKQKAELDELRCSASFVEAGGLPGFVYLGSMEISPRSFALFREARGNRDAFTVSKDQRGEGLTLYRYDEKVLDFAVLAGDPLVSFWHRNGFVAKTTAKCTLDQALALVERARVYGPQL